MKLAPRLGHDMARRTIDTMQAEIGRRGLSAIMAITDSHGDLMAFLRMDGAALSSIDVAINKAFSASRVGTSTREIGQSWRNPATAFDPAYYGTHRIVGWAGGLPIRIEGEIVGAVAVSGLTEELDEEIAGIAVKAIVDEMSELRNAFAR